MNSQMLRFVMISSTSRDLPEYRDHAKEAVIRKRLFPLMMEIDTAMDMNAITYSRQLVEEAQVYIGIFAHRYGYVPEDSETSITEMEYRWAIERGIPILIFLIDERYQIPVNQDTIDIYFERSDDKKEKLRALKEELKKKHVVGFFTTPQNLGEQIYQALSNLRSEPNVPPPPSDAVYRKWLLDETDTIDIRGLGGTHAVTSIQRFSLLKLYMRLSIQQSQNPVSEQAPKVRVFLEDEVKKHRCNVILGDPGAGKTTFLRYLARTALEDPSKPLPLFMRAADLFSFIQERPHVAAAHNHNQLISYWLHLSEEYGWGFTRPWLTEQFQAGKAVILMDGLDELPTPNDRADIMRIVDSGASVWQGCGWILTSRYGVLQGGAAPPPRFVLHKIGVLGDAEIEHFINAYVDELFQMGSTLQEGDKYHAAQYKRELLSAIQNRRDVNFLGRNPVMLTSMIIVHWNQRRLPSGKAALYEAVIQWLISTRGKRISKEDNTWKLRKCYQGLALAMFLHPDGRQTAVPRFWAAEQISKYFTDEAEDQRSDKALAFLEQGEVNTGLIVSREGGKVAFWHASFQEFLAASEIATRPDDPEIGWWNIIRDRLFDSEWQEVIKFIPVVFMLRNMGESRVDLYLQRILETRQASHTLPEAAKYMQLMGPILHDLKVFNYTPAREQEECVPGFKDLQAEVLRIFEREAETELDLITRHKTAIALGQGGDPRLEEPAANWVAIPAGYTQVGSQRDSSDEPNYDAIAEEEEKPVHWVYTAAFEIGKYPVTVQEFARFVDSGGYHKESVWSPEGWKWRTEQDLYQPDHWDEQLACPNCPVVYVDWFEAQAYCQWLSEQDERWLYRLPTEAEWEYMARCGSQTYQRYVFGNVFLEDGDSQTNWDRCGLQQLAPIGLFPLDQTAHGVLDVNGNVCEWVQDAGPIEYPVEPVRANLFMPVQDMSFRYWRGGGWNDLSELLRTASRTCILPHLRYDDGGFRVLRVRKPISVKGKIPLPVYHFTLADVYAKHLFLRRGVPYSLQQANDLLSALTPRLHAENVLWRLFPPAVRQEERPFRHLPCLMREIPGKLDFNLLYQDTRLKLAVEEKKGTGAVADHYERDASTLTEIAAILLSTQDSDGHAIWENMTDNDLDALIYMILDEYDPSRSERLLQLGYEANQRALEGLPPLQDLQEWSLDRLIDYQTFAGTVWWHECESRFEAQFLPGQKFRFGTCKNGKRLKQLAEFERDILREKCHLVFLFDDNGELVWDLVLIWRLLQMNSQLQITGVINNPIVANNASQKTVSRCLEAPFGVQILQTGRFHFFYEDNFRSAPDPNYCSSALLELIQNADVVYIKGVSFFETIQNLPTPTYYGFVVHSEDSQICTGLQKGEAVLVRIPSGESGYTYHQQTLKEVCALFD